jgi:catechol 2,3-dioxygenase-like lactoylglutathione lyase family enzyme
MERTVQPFDNLGHINLKVNDLQASIDFYQKLGFPEFLRLTNEEGSPWIVYLKVTDAFYIELGPGGHGSRAGDTEATGLNHLCLTTPDIEMTVAELDKAGVPLAAPLDPKRRGLDRNRGCWIADPDGNRIEIMEMAPNCLQFEALAHLRDGKGTLAVVTPGRAPAKA